ncbi:MAG: magnesium/cobalt transporter CorA [Chloroflexaceae bacterium]|jgi:magnesium transporter|nr:magnesium/cobalt transporter CorA [Chloroflexaceae bacterium]
MRRLLVCHDGRFHPNPQPEDISEALKVPNQTVWLDIRDPTDEDAALLQEEFNFHPLAIEDSLRENQRAKVEVFDHYYFVVFYAALYDVDNKQIETQPLHLFIGANYLVSIHRGPIRQIDETLRRWQTPNSPLGYRIGGLAHALLDAVVDDYFPLIDQVTDEIEDLEDTIFRTFKREAIQTIFSLKRDLLTLRRAVGPGRDVMNVLLRRELPIFKTQDIIYLQDVYDHVVRVTDSIDTYRDLLSNALDSYLSLQSNQQNQILKVLTIASIILMANALIAGIYGMNFEFMPELTWPYGYFYALGLMATVTTGLIIFFRRMKWW